MIPRRPIISGFTERIFIKFSLNGRYFVVDYFSYDLTFFDRPRDVAMATNYSDKIDEIRLFAIIRRSLIPKRIGISQRRWEL